MHNDQIPVILIHGWNSHPGAWKQLCLRLDTEGIPSVRFDHTGMNGAPLETIAQELGRFMRRWRLDTGYHGPVDLVCHSIGTCIARYYLEICDGEKREEQVSQLIALGPPNNGSALAELFVHPVHGARIINRLTGTFVPDGYDPASDATVQDVRPTSPAMKKFKAAGIRPDITYRILVTANPGGTKEFFPLFEGLTWEMARTGSFRQTLAGDGIVAHTESALPGISLDVIPASCETDEGLPPPTQYCHIFLTRNPQVLDRILEYLKKG